MRSYINRILISSLLLLNACIEEFIPETLTFEDFLVVEATITDEFKFQEIKLSRTFEFGENPIKETQAIVQIIDDSQNSYNFSETESGNYVSNVKFSVEPNRTYTLKVTTKNSMSYTSSAVMLPSNTAQITDVSYSKSTNSNFEEGIDILVDSFDPSGNSKYYRYEFEETYIILPPFWSQFEIIIVSDVPPFKVDHQFRTREERVCYNTIISNDIIQTETNSLSEDRITKFPVKFISSNDSIIRDRYSILVKQHVQSLEAFTYYKILNEFSISENVFSENQPGFLEGNIFSDTSPNEKVIGFFEINSVSSKRLFLNYKDVFPNENKPPYFAECVEIELPDLVNPEDPNNSPLIDRIKSGMIHIETHYTLSGDIVESSPYYLINIECGDCTVFGTNIRPDFWID